MIIAKERKYTEHSNIWRNKALHTPKLLWKIRWNLQFEESSTSNVYYSTGCNARRSYGKLCDTVTLNEIDFRIRCAEVRETTKLNISIV